MAYEKDRLDLSIPTGAYCVIYYGKPLKKLVIYPDDE